MEGGINYTEYKTVGEKGTVEVQHRETHLALQKKDTHLRGFIYISILQLAKGGGWVHLFM